MKTYTAQVGPKNAKRLAELTALDIDNIGEGTVQVNDLERLRALGASADGGVTEDADGLQIWIDGEGFPLFDGTEAAVADALGMQTEYNLAKRAADHARDLYAAAVATVVDLAGSAQGAADLIGIDRAEVEQLVPTAAVPGTPAATPTPTATPTPASAPASTPAPAAPPKAPKAKAPKAKPATAKKPKVKTGKSATVPGDSGG